MSYDYFESQRQVALARQRKLTDQARAMSNSELLDSLSWEHALREHYDEIGQSNNCGVKASVIRTELARRGVI